MHTRLKVAVAVVAALLGNVSAWVAVDEDVGDS
jgi:hypothetical protein